MESSFPGLFHSITFHFNRLSAITINYAEEAVGITLAAGEANLPVVISFTVETDDRLPTGMRLKEALAQVDNSTPQPLYYMINCTHPSHFSAELQTGISGGWTNRVKGLRANASCKSHAELDAATEPDRGNPQERGDAYKKLQAAPKQVNVLGGCCGTDQEHVRAIAQAVTTVG